MIPQQYLDCADEILKELSAWNFDPSENFGPSQVDAIRFSIANIIAGRIP